ncbi:MAG: hypothetical protein LBM96_01835 [Methanobrevibacter sp.]|jgi:hypothetical protein|nr:hypothetical protein [Candidatus Methanoflexus mossambicus]
MNTIIKVFNLINRSLESNKSAELVFDEINKSKDNNIIVDFANVVAISRSFVQSYSAQKKKSNKNISEINITKDYENMFKMIEKQILMA